MLLELASSFHHTSKHSLSLCDCVLLVVRSAVLVYERNLKSNKYSQKCTPFSNEAGKRCKKMSEETMIAKKFDT
jgi:hypothetical protein